MTKHPQSSDIPPIGDMDNLVYSQESYVTDEDEGETRMECVPSPYQHIIDYKFKDFKTYVVDSLITDIVHNAVQQSQQIVGNSMMVQPAAQVEVQLNLVKSQEDSLAGQSSSVEQGSQKSASWRLDKSPFIVKDAYKESCPICNEPFSLYFNAKKDKEYVRTFAICSGLYQQTQAILRTCQHCFHHYSAKFLTGHAGCSGQSCVICPKVSFAYQDVTGRILAEDVLKLLKQKLVKRVKEVNFVTDCADPVFLECGETEGGVCDQDTDIAPFRSYEFGSDSITDDTVGPSQCSSISSLDSAGNVQMSKYSKQSYLNQDESVTVIVPPSVKQPLRSKSFSDLFANVRVLELPYQIKSSSQEPQGGGAGEVYRMRLRNVDGSLVSQSFSALGVNFKHTSDINAEKEFKKAVKLAKINSVLQGFYEYVDEDTAFDILFSFDTYRERQIAFGELLSMMFPADRFAGNVVEQVCKTPLWIPNLNEEIKRLDLEVNFSDVDWIKIYELLSQQHDNKALVFIKLAIMPKSEDVMGRNGKVQEVVASPSGMPTRSSGGDLLVENVMHRYLSLSVSGQSHQLIQPLDKETQQDGVANFIFQKLSPSLSSFDVRTIIWVRISLSEKDSEYVKQINNAFDYLELIRRARLLKSQNCILAVSCQSRVQPVSPLANYLVQKFPNLEVLIMQRLMRLSTSAVDNGLFLSALKLNGISVYLHQENRAATESDMYTSAKFSFLESLVAANRMDKAHNSKTVSQPVSEEPLQQSGSKRMRGGAERQQ
ncbi:hypothetical protein MP228_002382 [Amoeboaphelidium protococcarum]|nr:hypothetical protein MP228_002382 [Amoeboaphelidium protococcarum]